MFRKTKKEKHFSHSGRKRETDNLKGNQTEAGTTFLAQQRLEKKGTLARGLVLVPGAKGCTSLVSFHMKGILRYAGVQMILPKSLPEKSYLETNCN